MEPLSVNSYKTNNSIEVLFLDVFAETFVTDSNLISELSLLIDQIASLPTEKSYKAVHDIGDLSFVINFHNHSQKAYLGSTQSNYELALKDLSRFPAGELSAEVDSFILKLGYFNQSEYLAEFDRIVMMDEGKPAPTFCDETKDLTDSYIQSLKQEMVLYRASLFEKLSDYGLNLTSEYALYRIHLLKFLAILPSLDFDRVGSEVKRILCESIRRLLIDSNKFRNAKKGENQPIPFFHYVFLKFTLYFSFFCPSLFLSMIVRKLVKSQAKRFIAGESIETSSNSLSQLRATNRDFTLDQLGELVVSEEEADEYCDKIIQMIEGMILHTEKGELNAAGIARAHISIKISALSADFRPHAFDHTYNLVAPRLRKILVKAKEHDVFIQVDAEHYHFRDLVFEIYQNVLLETPQLHSYQQTGIVIQAYLRDAFLHYIEVLELAKKRKLLMPIRLVKGAYWDAETVEGDAHNFPAPQFLNKVETDLQFKRILHKSLEDFRYIQMCLASHNLYDHCFAEALRKSKYPDAPIIEHQCLHMTYETLSVSMAKQSWVVRNYVPVGSLLVGMAYLVRRIMENSSQVGILKMMRSHRNNISIKHPEDIYTDLKTTAKLSFDFHINSQSSRFKNCAPLRLYKRSHRSYFYNILNSFKPITLSNELNGKAHKVFSPSDGSVVGQLNYSAISDVEVSVQKAQKARLAWGESSIAYKGQIFLRAALMMHQRRAYLASLICYESGKNIDEALADVDEAIDFINFYVREEIKIGQTFQTVMSRGLVVAITPWNFPLAIPCGMITGPLVAGNTVILKSAEQSPLIASVLTQLFHDAGLPADVLIHLPGEGHTIGNALASHEVVKNLVFTGSKSVGVHLYKKLTAKINFDNFSTSKIITEMGGKNAIIVTANAELDETVSGILYAAFAHAGQKCSACSRILIDKQILPQFLMRFKKAVHDLKVGSALEGQTFINPLISKEDVLRVQNDVSLACKEAVANGGTVIVNRSLEELPGNCIGPTVIELPASYVTKNKQSYAHKELFAPVVHIIGFSDLNHAISLFNDVDYGLTGGIYCQSQDDIDYLVSKLDCGNIYINRPNTGARVGIEPFGGFKLSGTGPKAGSKDYIRAFHNFTAPYDINHRVETHNDEGSDYRYYLYPKSSKREIKSYADLFHAMDVFLHFFKLDKSTMNEVKTEMLDEFIRFLRDNGHGFRFDRHNNTEVPGQLSYDDHTISMNYGFFYSNQDRPNLHTMIYFLASMAMGVQNIIFTRNKKGHEFWSSLAKNFKDMGWGEFFLQVYYASDALILSSLKEPEIDFICMEGDSDFCKKIVDEHIIHFDNYKKMTKILTHIDAPRLGDWNEFLKLFICKRSLAINTMRHGAPLDLQL